MDIKQLRQSFSESKEKQMKAIFSSLFMISNKLQVIFDNHVEEVSLKQFMLLTLLRQSDQELSLTQLGSLLGCSRQNVKKLANVLEKKGFVQIKTNNKDSRSYYLSKSDKLEQYFQNEFMIHQQELTYLFDVYSDEEIQQLFVLMMKLYDGIDHLKERVKNS